MADDADAASTSAAAAAQAAAQAMLVKISTEGMPKLFCPICNKGLVSLNGYVKHLQKHEPPGGFLCRYCDARFCSDDELKKHRETEHTTIACRLCKDVNFTNEDDYRTHIRDIHQGIDREIYNCEKCGAAYKTIEPYRRHMETECGKIKPFKCSICPMAFVTKYNLKQHLENHSGELKFCCSYCGRNFKQKARLVEHERTHTGEKPYKCDVCGKSFSHRESIVTHSSIHTGIRLVECKCCGSRFSCYSNLIKHRRNRPDTCGQPEFDPPRNRVRKHTSRIPATLNPNSEIKVVNENKVIKPDDKVKFAATKKESPEKPKTKPTARKRTGGAPPKPASVPPKRAYRKRAATAKKKVIDFDELDDEDLKVEKFDFSCDEDEDYFANPKDKRDQAAAKAAVSAVAASAAAAAANINKSLPIQPSTNWSDESDDDFIPDFEPDESDNDEKCDFKLPLPSTNIKKEVYDIDDDDDLDLTTDLQIEPLEEYVYNHLETTYGEVDVKDEDDYDDDDEERDNLFNNKDEILEHLLNENDYAQLDEEESKALKTTLKRKRALKAQRQQTVDSDDILEETEVVFIKYEDSDEDGIPVEDTLEEAQPEKREATKEDVTDCYVIIEDIKLRFPQLQDDASVKVPKNVQPFFSTSDTMKKFIKRRGRFRPRGPRPIKKEPVDGEEPEAKRDRKAYRMAKVSARELKERIRQMKKRDKTYKCPECIKIYFMRKPFQKHLREEHKKTDEELKEMFKDDLSELDTEDVFKCPICDKIYLMEKRLIDHIPKHGPDGSLVHKCPCYCALYFGSPEEATAHAQVKHKELLWCEICEKFMTGCDPLKSHKARVHGDKTFKNSRNLICTKCGKKFLGRTQLTDHERSDCGRIPLYQCQECGKCLTTAGILKTHMLLHDDARPFQCDQCGKTFKIKAQYKTHIRFAHTDEKRFKCHLCPKAYPYRESLLTHMSVHTGIKRFMCNGCGKRFTCVSNLQAHRKVQAESCGLLPLNAKATQYMGIQKGSLLMGAKPEPGLDYVETQTFLAKELYTHDVPPMVEDEYIPGRHHMHQESSVTDGIPLNYSGSDLVLMYNHNKH